MSQISIPELTLYALFALFVIPGLTACGPVMPSQSREELASTLPWTELRTLDNRKLKLQGSRCSDPGEFRVNAHGRFTMECRGRYPIYGILTREDLVQLSQKVGVLFVHDFEESHDCRGGDLRLMTADGEPRCYPEGLDSVEDIRHTLQKIVDRYLVTKIKNVTHTPVVGPAPPPDPTIWSDFRAWRKMRKEARLKKRQARELQDSQTEH